MSYVRKPTPAEAWVFDPKVPQSQWPAWVANHEVSTLMGLQKIGLGTGVLLIPTKGGVTANVPPGDVLVLEAGVLTVVKGADFPNLFAEVDAAEPEPAPVAEAE